MSALRACHLLVLTAFGAGLAPHAAQAGPLESYLPRSGTIQGHVVELFVAPEDQVISRRFQLAVQGNMDWFKHYVISTPAGEPLPYNPKMGVTEAQYTQLLHMKAVLREKAPITIAVRRDPDGSVAFESGDPGAASLQATHFPPGATQADTPFGPLSTVTEIHQKDANAPFGVWNGAEWAKVAEPGSDQPSAKIAFGRREPSGEGIFYYQVSAHGNRPEQSLVVTYPLDRP